MEKRFIITLEDLAANGFIHGNVEADAINPIILRVQDRIIQSALGTNLYTKILDLIEAYDNGDGTEVPAPYKNLLEKYIQPAIIPYIEMRSTTFLSWRIRNAGVGQFKDGQYFSPSNKQETRNLQQDIEGDATHYFNVLVAHLKSEGTATYPEYTCSQTCEGMSPAAKKKTPGNFFFLKGNEIC